MSDLDPLALRDALQDTLARYTATAVPISDERAPRLAAAVRSALHTDGEAMVRGPYLESLPDFEKGRSIRQLVEDGILTSNWERMVDSGHQMLFDRSLHRHQETAILRAKEANYLVSTGTGSGKTEAFLYPLVDELLRSGDVGAPGVRAILVYPLNALANDQLYYRIARLLLRELGDPGITFGRFTGQIRSGVRRAEEEKRLLQNEALTEALGLGNHISESWLLSREEMLATPPQILVTNYAMLEHLLLLPQNAPLFAGADLRFIVLDEVHSYSGAQAIEVAFLLRKLKTRLNILQGQVRTIGTSASLDTKRSAELVSFAENLFGEDFGHPAQAVITGKRLLHSAFSLASSNSDMTPEAWANVSKAIASLPDHPTIEDWNIQCRAFGCAGFVLPADGGALGPALFKLAANLRQVKALAVRLEEGLARFEDIARHLFPESELADANTALRGIVALGVLARRSRAEFPLLPARFHLAVNGIEGGVISLAEGSEPWKTFRPQRSYKDPGGQPFYPLLVCRNCGEPYIEGWQGHSVLHAKPRPGTKRAVIRLLSQAPAFEDESLEDDVDSVGGEWLHIAPATGDLDNSARPGLVSLFSAELDEADEKRPRLKSCLVCGEKGGRYLEPISGLHPGDDAFAAVATQQLIEALPRQAAEGEVLPMEGRRVIVFSDNRQDAAFFAPFFERTSRDGAIRAAIIQVLATEDDAIALTDLRDEAAKILKGRGTRAFDIVDPGSLDPITPKAAKAKLLNWVAAEFCRGAGMRSALENLGLVHVDYTSRDIAAIANEISAAVPSTKNYAADLARLFLDFARRQRLITNLDEELDLGDASVWGDGLNQQHRVLAKVRPANTNRPIVGLKPAGGRPNRFTWFLEARLGLSAGEAIAVLDAFWNGATRSRVLRAFGDAGQAIDPMKLLFSVGNKHLLYRCSVCGGRTMRSVEGKCASRPCDGILRPLDSEERLHFETENHYVRRYRNSEPQAGIAREHSAVIGTEMREGIENRFREGRLNLLSCTTTMEMGVDLGDLEAIVCRNVPPSISSYQQRAGRAGRRAQAAPVALTVARNGNYDQEQYRHFDQYLKSPPGVPYVALDNPDFFRRHQVSVLLSAYLLRTIRAQTTPRLKDLFSSRLDASQLTKFVESVQAFLEAPSGLEAIAEAERLRDHLPSGQRQVGLGGIELAQHTLIKLTAFANEYAMRWQALEERLVQARIEQNDGYAFKLGKEQERLLDQYLVNALSRAAVIPTYSFPVHSVRLEVIQQSGTSASAFGKDEAIQLDRQAVLGISEYAPGAEVVAAGRIWVSAGIVRYPKDFMPDRVARICTECRHVTIADFDDQLPDECGQCGGSSFERAHRFIEPKAFLTSLDMKAGRDPSASRVRQRSAEEARLVTTAPPHLFSETDLGTRVSTFFAPARPLPGEGLPQGQLFVLNKGPKGAGYHRCKRCEHAQAADAAYYGRAIKSSHKDPRTGASCPADELLRPIHLGHIFETDVRAFRFSSAIPEDHGVSDDIDDSSARRRFTRTLGEALRIAAARLIDADPRDIAATMQIDANRPIAVLYDTVPGGAGYVRRLDNGMEQLVRRAIALLDCSANCASACRQCLSDYGNQAYWEDLDRLPVLQWLRDLVAQIEPHDDLPIGATLWADASLAGLAGRLAGSQQIVIFATRFAGGDAIEGPVLETARFLRDLAERDPTRKIFLAIGGRLPVSLADLAPSELVAAEMLAQLEKSGDLSVFRLPADKFSSALPRLFAQGSDGAMAMWSDDGDRPLLAGLLGDCVHIAVGLDEAVTDGLVERLKCGQPVPGAFAGILGSIRVWDFAAGVPRDFEAVFAMARGHVTRLEIEDPFLLKDHRARRAVGELLSMLKQQGVHILSVALTWRENHPRDHGETPEVQRAEMERILMNSGHTEIPIDMHCRSYHDRGAFHDRVMRAEIAGSDGHASQLQWDLSSGVGNLMDRSCEAKVYLRIN